MPLNMPENNKSKAFDLTEGISVFFLCYNDEATIGMLVDDAVRVLKEITDNYEVIVVNDGSADRSFSILEQLTKKHRVLKIVNHEMNRGYGAAIKNGLKASSKGLIFYTDGDGQYDVKELPKLLNSINGFDMVNGYISKRSDPFYRILLGKIYAALLKKILAINMRYVDCDYRLFKRHVIKDLNLDSDGGFICAEMLKKIIDKGYKIKEVPVSHYPRRSGSSQFFRVRNISKLLLDFIEFNLTYKRNKISNNPSK